MTTEPFAVAPASIRKAIVRYYDVATHKAHVQLVGSHPTVVESVRVATDIPAGDVVAGRQCTVLFLDPANQDDAIVLTIQGNLPSGGGGVSDHGLLSGLGDDDHPQYGALAQAETVAANWTFGAGLQLAASQTIKDSGGTGRILLSTAAYQLTLTGAVKATASGAHGATQLLAERVGAQGSVDLSLIEASSTASFSGDGRLFIGLKGQPKPTFAASSVGHSLHGLDFGAVAGSGASSIGIGEAIAVTVYFGSVNFSGTITKAGGIQIVAPVVIGSPAYTTAFGLDLFDPLSAKIVDYTHLALANITGATGFRRHIEALGLTNTNLRVEAGDPTTPGALKGRAQLLAAFNENGVIALRRVEWVDAGAAGGAGLPANAKVLVAI